MENYNMASNMRRDMILKFISERMKELGISRYRLSKLTGISESTIKRYFDKEIDMTLLNLLKICGALKIRPYLVESEADDTDMKRIYFN